ncbi:hypothetical protein H2248_006844 [Termitomyces sp. 'cryptogamus']|nr:hypothetical protein H2248_006844 [Termitomyces sp. 'cryptogamus']
MEDNLGCDLLSGVRSGVDDSHWLTVLTRTRSDDSCRLIFSNLLAFVASLSCRDCLKWCRSSFCFSVHANVDVTGRRNYVDITTYRHLSGLSSYKITPLT